MSVPIRSRTCGHGCIMATRNNYYDNKPWWAHYGYDEITVKNTCPVHKLETHRQEIKNLFSTVIGYLKWNIGTYSRYIVIAKHKYRTAFSGKDVYCEECKCWHFKEIS